MFLEDLACFGEFDAFVEDLACFGGFGAFFDVFALRVLMFLHCLYHFRVLLSVSPCSHDYSVVFTFSIVFGVVLRSVPGFLRWDCFSRLSVVFRSVHRLLTFSYMFLSGVSTLMFSCSRLLSQVSLSFPAKHTHTSHCTYLSTFPI